MRPERLTWRSQPPVSNVAFCASAPPLSISNCSNVLADKYATGGMHTYCPPQVCTRSLLTQELLAWYAAGRSLLPASSACCPPLLLLLPSASTYCPPLPSRAPCLPQYLRWGYRKQLLTQELLALNADILCLQEVCPCRLHRG